MSRSDQYGSESSQTIFSDYKGEPLRSITDQDNDDVNNIVEDYDWTYSLNRQLREEVPRLTIREFKIAGNTYIASLVSSALVFKQGISDVGEQATSLVNAINEAAASPFGGFMGKIASGLVKGTVDAVSNAAQKTTQFITDVAVKQYGNSDNTADAWASHTGNGEMKENYQYMYLRLPTNRKYIFPYFNDDFYKQNNNFQDTLEAKSYLEGAIQKVADASNQFATSANTKLLEEPGMYIERPKFYGFSGDGKEFTVEFYLYNTIRENEYLNNMKLLTKLITQNTPHRVNRILVDPPCIYELEIPGRGFYPYAFISNLEVLHVGTRRMIDNQIVPDAFKVTIVLKSLIMDTNNITSFGMGTAGIDISKRYKYSAPNETKAVPVQQAGTETKPRVENTGGSVTVNGKQIMSNSGFLPSR